MPIMRLRPGLRPGPHLEGSPEGEGEEEKARGGWKGKIVATRCQILWLKCENALYKCTDLLTYLHQ